MSSTEPKAYEIMTSLDVDYVLVIFGGLIGYSGDDINKFLWMVRIAEGEHPQDIRVWILLSFDNSVYNTTILMIMVFIDKYFNIYEWRRPIISLLKENTE